MLALSRKKNEAIIVRKDGVEIARIIIVDIDRGNVRIGLVADQSIQFIRSELIGTDKDRVRQRQEA